MRKLAIRKPTFEGLFQEEFLSLYDTLISMLKEQYKKDQANGKSTQYRLSNYLMAAEEWKKRVYDGEDPIDALKEEFIFKKGRFEIPVLNQFVKILEQHQD